MSLYSVLEIPPTANAEEVKRAYRKLSLIYHPDKNKDESFSRRYIEIKDAYEILGNIESRKKYDSEHSITPPLSSPPKPSSSSSSSFTSSPPFMTTAVESNGGIHHFSGQHLQPFLSSQTPLPLQQQQHQQQQQIIMKTIHIPLKMSLEGGKVPIQVDRWTLDLYTKTSYFESVTVYVDIFEGIDDNEMIVLKGQGNYGGDLKVFVKIDNTTDFTRSGLDLIFTKQITLKESLCGFQFDLMLLNDKVLTIKNKRGNVISPHFEKRIPNMGIKREQRVGSLIIKFDILFPSYLAANAIDTIEKLF